MFQEPVTENVSGKDLPRASPSTTLGSTHANSRDRGRQVQAINNNNNNKSRKVKENNNNNNNNINNKKVKKDGLCRDVANSSTTIGTRGAIEEQKRSNSSPEPSSIRRHGSRHNDYDGDGHFCTNNHHNYNHIEYHSSSSNHIECSTSTDSLISRCSQVCSYQIPNTGKPSNWN